MQLRSYENVLHQRPLKSHSRCQHHLSRFHEHQLQSSKSDGHYRQLTSLIRHHLTRPFCQTLRMHSDNSRTWDGERNQRPPKRRRRAFLVMRFLPLQGLRLFVTDLIILGTDLFLRCPWQQLRVWIQSGSTTSPVILLGAVPQLAITKKPRLSVLYERSPQFIDQQQAGNVALRPNSIEQGLHLYPVQTSATSRGIHRTVSGLNTGPISRKAHLRPNPKPRRKWSQCPSQRGHQERR